MSRSGMSGDNLGIRGCLFWESRWEGNSKGTLINMSTRVASLKSVTLVGSLRGGSSPLPWVMMSQYNLVSLKHFHISGSPDNQLLLSSPCPMNAVELFYKS